MTEAFHRRLLSELHMAVYEPGDPTGLTDALLCEAVTLNENLHALGYTLRPEDLLRLAVSPSLHSFYDDIQKLVPEVAAQPMYPGFPQQVMQMDEAEFRFHQLLHYFTTYGIEALTGLPVQRGWLPTYDAPARTESDTRLLDAAVLQLVPEEESAIAVLRALLSRRERLTNPELALVLESAALCSAAQMEGLSVPFKENLTLLFPLLLDLPDRETALRTMYALCPHVGDVLRCAQECLSAHSYHLRTSQKKLLVKLLERYPVWNFQENLMQSNSLRERALTILQHLDYNQYSRSPEHREAVRALRNGELVSWHSVGESLLAAHSPRALPHLAERPGYMLRMLRRLLTLGYTPEAILEQLLPKAQSLSAHLIMSVLQALTTRKVSPEDLPRYTPEPQVTATDAWNFARQLQEQKAWRELHQPRRELHQPRRSPLDEQLVQIFKTLLTAHFEAADTPLRAKKVCLQLDAFDLAHSALETAERSKDGGYIRSGIAWKIPEQARYVRFFVYWNDSKRVDVDLHANALNPRGSLCHVGWDSSFRGGGLCFSGDITHSDAAEYIDIDTTIPLEEVYARVHLYSGRSSFRELETCYVGLMAVDKIDADVKLYDPANCFFTHALTQEIRDLYYGYVNIPQRFVRFVGKPMDTFGMNRVEFAFSLQDYLDVLLQTQRVQLTTSAEEADLVLTMGKSLLDNGISLVDENFFLEW